MTRLEHLPEHAGRASQWEQLRVHGLVARPLMLTHVDLAGLPASEIIEDFRCEEGWIVPAQAWQGVPVREVLKAAEPLAEAEYVAFSEGGFSVALSIEEAQASNALLALRLNGESLPPVHGGPCRLVIPGKDCYFSIKWLDQMEVTSTRPVDTARDIALGRIEKTDAPEAWRVVRT